MHNYDNYGEGWGVGEERRGEVRKPVMGGRRTNTD
jgi:hypothetical protein